ncbi:uncharacterized protein LOC123889868 [Trifolium pratense]|uniref:uncharacterized protein LOC123889868 n=1 Tax=Trifolium pratense TaxID=57577 RepID=UPI001E6931F2|nr:uncharacterized protein LOC123889868 [Trifolium pratense]
MVLSGEMDKEGGTVSKPPLLTGPENYDYWKARMMVFLKSIDSRTWKAVVHGWEIPYVVDKDGKTTNVVKSIKDYYKEEDELALGNSKALNAIFNGVDINMFRLVKRSLVAKDAWEILRKAHEGTSKVKLSKLQMLSTNFENLCMKEEETVHDFHMNVLEFANNFDALGENISEEKLASKILRSLPKRFDMKVTAIEEAQDLASIQVDELIGSLQTYELSINQRKDKKNKSLAFTPNARDEQETGDQESDESLSEAMVLLGKQFNKLMKRMDKQTRPNVPSIRFDTNKQPNNLRRPRSDEKPNQPRGVLCHECEGHGHIRAECPTFLKGQKKSLAVTWSDDDDSEEEGESESAKLVYALTGRCESDAETCDGTSYEELMDTYKELLTSNYEVCKALERLKKTNFQLQAEKSDCLTKIDVLNKVVEKLSSELEHARKQVEVYSIGDEKYRAMLMNQSAGKKPIGFDYEIINQQTGYNKATINTPIDKTFPVSSVQPSTNLEKGVLLPPLTATNQKTYSWLKAKPKYPVNPEPVFQHPSAHRKNWPKPRYRRHNWRCHHCGRKGHIRPYCYRLYGYPKRTPNLVPEADKVETKREWKEKEKDVSLIAHTSLRASSRQDWYFDSGCSRHMTGVEGYLVNLKSYATSYVTFGDGAKGEIKGIGNLINAGVPNLDNVLLVKGLTANLISISQLCDQGMKVNFTQSECLVTNEEGTLMMRGVRSRDNCYLWVSEEENHLSTCYLSKEDEVKLWHQKLGHLHLREMKNAIVEEAIRGLPKLKIEEGNICGECRIGKQTRMSHPKLQHPVTSRTLELLHIDLIGPMQTESLGGKRYVFVMVDDFSRFTWIDFLREKSDSFEIFKNLCLQLQREKETVIMRVRSDHGKKFKNERFFDFCASEEALSTTCYIHNRVTLRVGTSTTLYELWNGRKPTVKHFHVFGSKCYILADREQRRKLNPKSEEGIFLGYSTNSKAYRVYNSRTKIIMESVNVVVDDSPSTKTADVEEDVEPSIQQSDDTVCEEDSGSKIESTDPKSVPAPVKVPSTRTQKNHPKELIIGNPDQGITTRRNNDVISSSCFVSKYEPKYIVKLEHVATEEHVGDIFTKALDVVQIERIRGQSHQSCHNHVITCNQLSFIYIHYSTDLALTGNIVDATVQPFVVVNDHVAPSNKSTSDFVVTLVTFSIKEKTTTLDVAQDVGTSYVQPNPNAATITESFGDSSDSEAATEAELQDKENNDIPANVVEDSKTEESREKVVSLCDKYTESEKRVDEEQEMIDLDEVDSLDEPQPKIVNGNLEQCFPSHIYSMSIDYVFDVMEKLQFERMIHALKLEEAALEATDARVDEICIPWGYLRL